MQNSYLVLILFLLFAYSANAQCLSGDCNTGNGIQIYPTGERYIGQFKNGKSHGLGTYFYEDGRRSVRVAQVREQAFYPAIADRREKVFHVQVDHHILAKRG